MSVTKPKVVPKILDLMGGPYLELVLENGPMAIPIEKILGIGVNKEGYGHLFVQGIQIPTLHSREEILKSLEYPDEGAGEMVTSASPLLGVARNLD